MLTLYRLHKKDCKRGYSRLDRSGSNCACPVHVEGKLGAEFLRRSTGTQSMEKARNLVVAAEKRGAWDATAEPEPEPVTWMQGKPLSEAVDEFLADCADERGRNLAGPTLVKYRTLLSRLKEFGERTGIVTLTQLTFTNLTAFKREWPTGSGASIQNITRLRTFLGWCVKHGWISSNPAEAIEFPKHSPVERIPYTPEEMAAILEAARTIKLDPQQPVTHAELETFVLLMRYTGLAISDAALLETAEVRGDEIRLYRNKTSRNAKRVLVVVPMPPSLVQRLKALPLQHKRYYFAHDSPTLGAQSKTWQRRLQMIFRSAGITHDPGSHRFRHTFATDLLEKGYPIELVSRWLGHDSIKVTQEHYSHWIESRIKAASDQLRRLYTAEHEPGA